MKKKGRIADVDSSHVTADHDDDFQDETDLEPHDLIRRSNLVIRIGSMMLGAGTSSLRVKQAMQSAAHALGISRIKTQVTYTHVGATVHRGTIFRTQIGEITVPGVDAAKIQAIQRLSRRMPAVITTDGLKERLDEINARKPLHPQWLVILAVGLACASVGFLNGAGWREVLAILVGGGVSFAAHRQLLGRRLNIFGSVVLSTMVASGVYLAAAWALHGGTLRAPLLATGFMAVSIFLVPGFPLLTGSLDVARLDLQAGIGRIVYAGVVMLSISIGSWAIASLVGLQPSMVTPPGAASLLTWGFRIVASFLAVFGWALMFNSPWRESVASGLVAIVGSLLRLGLLDASVVPHVATFCGALLMGVLCHAASKWFGLTRLIMLVPTLLVMIPGAPALRALLLFNSGDLMGTLTNGISVVLQVLAMVCGLVASMMALDPAWAFHRSDLTRRRG